MHRRYVRTMALLFRVEMFAVDMEEPEEEEGRNDSKSDE